MIAFGPNGDYQYHFTPGCGQSLVVQLTKLEQEKSPRKKKRRMLLQRRSGMVTSAGFITVFFDEPVKILDFTFGNQERTLPSGSYVFELVLVRLPSVPGSTYEKAPEELVLLPGTSQGMAVTGLQTQQQRQHRRILIQQTEQWLLLVLQSKLMKHLVEKTLNDLQEV